MKTNDFINAILAMLGINESNYERTYFHLPRIYCKDGFNISVQVNDSSYCGSENGYRRFGKEWKLVEWGFPSAPIDSEEYGAQSCSDNAETVYSIGSVEIEKIDELMEVHGGIDILTTLGNAQRWMEQQFLYSRTRMSTN